MIPFLLTLAGCSSAKRPAVVPDTKTPARLAEADEMVRAGCLDCLVAAFNEYDQLRTIPAAQAAATGGAIRAAGLVALRERELGHADGGYLDRARAIAAAAPGASDLVLLDLDVIDTMGTGLLRSPTSDVDLDRMRRLRVNGDTWRARLTEHAADEALSAYAYLSFVCATTPPQTQTVDDLAAPIGALRETTLIAFKRATCRTPNAAGLAAVLAKEPRFLEVLYFQGHIAVGEAPRTGQASKLDEAEKLFDKVYAWRPRWPTLTHSIANLAMTAEDFDRALLYYTRTLELHPSAVDAQLGKIKTLTYTSRPAEAITATDTLLQQNWFVGDARYWRALNLSELDRQEEAWADIETASKLVVNPDVPKLAGLIAYRMRQLETSRDRFQLSLQRNKDDCETYFYLGIVNAELSDWPRTADVLTNASKCLQNDEERYAMEIERFRASSEPPERKALKIRRREQYIAKVRRQKATSFFNVAVASYNLRRNAEAREYAGKVADDEQFGERAREILSRLKER